MNRSRGVSMRMKVFIVVYACIWVSLAVLLEWMFPEHLAGLILANCIMILINCIGMLTGWEPWR